MYKDKEIPVKQGDVIYNQEILDTGRSGDGFTKVGAFVIFVPGTRVKVGKSYDLKIIKVLPTCAFGQIMEDDEL